MNLRVRQADGVQIPCRMGQPLLCPAPVLILTRDGKPFVEGNDVEHIWLSDIEFSGGRFKGKVDNTPMKLHGIKIGQVVSVNPDEISDWAYVDNGKLVGGYTIRAHYNQLTPDQKKEFLREADFKLE